MNGRRQETKSSLRLRHTLHMRVCRPPRLHTADDGYAKAHMQTCKPRQLRSGQSFLHPRTCSSASGVLYMPLSLRSCSLQWGTPAASNAAYSAASCSRPAATGGGRDGVCVCVGGGGGQAGRQAGAAAGPQGVPGAKPRLPQSVLQSCACAQLEERVNT
jgi:hypothetical protein